MPSVAHRYGVLLLALGLSACSDPQQDLFDTYHGRLSSALNVELSQASLPRPLVPYPEHSALQQSLPESEINLVEFLKLSGCRLSEVIGQRNSSLGKVAAASTQLMQTLDFLSQAPECILTLQEHNPALADKLQAAYQTKATYLPHYIWQATFAGPEYRALWQIPRALADYPKETNSQIPDSLQQWLAASERWLEGDYHYDAQRLEEWLFQIKQGDGGALLLASATLSQGLEQANALLGEKAKGSPLCFEQKNNPNGEYLFAVVQRYFIADIQRWAADLNRRAYALMGPIKALEQQLEVAMPERYQHWRAQRDAQLEQLTSAPKAHVKQLQPLLAQCNLAPSRPGH